MGKLKVVKALQGCVVRDLSFFCQGEAAGTDPKTTALTTLGLAMGAKNLRTLTRSPLSTLQVRAMDSDDFAYF